MSTNYWIGTQSNDFWNSSNWSAKQSPADFYETNITAGHAVASTSLSSVLNSLTISNDGTLDIDAQDCSATASAPVFFAKSFQVAQTGVININTASAVQLGGINNLLGTLNITNNQGNVFFDTANRLTGNGTLNLLSSTLGSTTHEIKIDNTMTVTLSGVSALYTGFMATGASVRFASNETETVFLDANDTTIHTAYTGVSANSRFAITANTGATPISAAYTHNANGLWSLVVHETGNRTLTLDNISVAAGYQPGPITITQDRTGDYLLGQGVSPLTTYWTGNGSGDFYDAANWNNNTSPLNYYGVNITGSNDAFAYASVTQASIDTIGSLAVNNQAELAITAHACNSTESAPVFAVNSFQTQASGMIAVQTDSAVQLSGLNENGGTLYIEGNRSNVFFGAQNRLTGNGEVFLQDSTLGDATHNIQIDNAMTVALSGASTVYSGFLATGRGVYFDPDSHQTYLLSAEDTTINTLFAGVSANTTFGIIAGTGATPVSASYEANSNGSFSLVVRESDNHTLTLKNIQPASTLTAGALAITKDSAGNYLLSTLATSAHATSFGLTTTPSASQTALWSSPTTSHSNAAAALPLSNGADHSALTLANDPATAKLPA